jgi:hypothetical protein
MLAWTCTNTARPICTRTTLATIEHLTGVDPFPALDDGQDRRRLRTSGRARASLHATD